MLERGPDAKFRGLPSVPDLLRFLAKHGALGDEPLAPTVVAAAAAAEAQAQRLNNRAHVAGLAEGLVQMLRVDVEENDVALSEPLVAALEGLVVAVEEAGVFALRVAALGDGARAEAHLRRVEAALAALGRAAPLAPDTLLTKYLVVFAWLLQGVPFPGAETAGAGGESDDGDGAGDDDSVALGAFERTALVALAAATERLVAEEAKGNAVAAAAAERARVRRLRAEAEATRSLDQRMQRLVGLSVVGREQQRQQS
jgi:hypothetical protein